jgi:TonB family protein
VSKIYDELRRAQESKLSRDTIPFDLLSSVIERVSPTIPLPDVPAAEVAPRINTTTQSAESSAASELTLGLASTPDVATTANQIELALTAAPDVVEIPPSIGAKFSDRSPSTGEPITESEERADKPNHSQEELQAPAKCDTSLDVAPPAAKVPFGVEPRYGEFDELFSERTAFDKLPGWRVSSRQAIFLSFLIMGLIGLVFVLHSRRNPQAPAGAAANVQVPQAPSQAQTLELKSERNGRDDWRLSWNGNAPSVQEASGAHIAINDGGRQKEFDLGLGELRNGSLVYSPKSDNVLVELRLRYNNSQQNVSEWVRIVDGKSSRVSAKGPAVAEAQAARNVRSVSPALTPKPAPPTPTAAIPADVNLKSVEGQAAVRNQVERPIESLAESHTDSQFQALASSGSTNPPSGAKPVETVPAAAGETALSVSTAPGARTVPIESPEAKLRGFAKTSVPAPDPAKLIRGGNPTYPAIARQAHIEGKVEIHFRITATGEIADPVATNGSAVLVPAALDALKSWRYSPARLNGVPVESVSQVTFNFKPN